MKPPPDALGRVEQPNPSAEVRRQAQRARRTERAFWRQMRQLRNRAVTLQCDRCLAVATGRITARGVLVSDGFKVEYGRHTVCSGGRCGGEVRAYDIAESITAT